MGKMCKISPRGTPWLYRLYGLDGVTRLSFVPQLILHFTGDLTYLPTASAATESALYIYIYLSSSPHFVLGQITVLLFNDNLLNKYFLLSVCSIRKLRLI